MWDIYITHSAVLPDPTLTPPQLGDGAPGWWSSPAKDASLAALNAEADPKKRGALWGNVQSVVFTEVPYIRVGYFNSVTARSPKLEGYVRDAVAVLLEHVAGQVRLAHVALIVCHCSHGWRDVPSPALPRTPLPVARGAGARRARVANLS